MDVGVSKGDDQYAWQVDEAGFDLQDVCCRREPRFNRMSGSTIAIRVNWHSGFATSINTYLTTAFASISMNLCTVSDSPPGCSTVRHSQFPLNDTGNMLGHCHLPLLSLASSPAAFLFATRSALLHHPLKITHVA